jgi:polar amino acid transport system substrate-binding protein
VTRRWMWAAAAVMGLITMWGVLPGRHATHDRADALQRLRAGEPLRVGYAVEPPYAVVRADGQVEGLAPEVARMVGQRLGVTRYEWIQTRFDALIPELRAHRFDVVAAGMFITAQREAWVAHSRPMMQVRSGVLWRRAAEDTSPAAAWHGWETVQRVAVIEGSVEHQRWLAGGGLQDRLMLVPDAASGQAAVLEGWADAFALSWPSVQWMAAHSQGRLQAQPLAPGELLGADLDHPAFQFRHEDQALRQAWDAALRDVLGSPQYAALLVRWQVGQDAHPALERAPREGGS